LQTLAANVLFETFPAESLRHDCGWTFFKNHGNDFLETLYMFLLTKNVVEGRDRYGYEIITIIPYPYLVEVLLMHCDEVMKKEITPFLLFKPPSLKTLEVLIRQNIDINYQLNPGDTYTLLHYAALEGNVEAARMLLDHGAQINAMALIPSTRSEQTPLGRALYKFNDNHPIIKLLRSRGALTYSEIIAQEEEQKQKEQRERRTRENRLVALAAVGDIAGVRSLLDQGVDINACNDNGETALWLAARNSYLKMVIFLLSKRANINVLNMNGNTALMLAAGNRNPALVCQLLMLGADVHRENEQGNTALMLAALNDSLEIVRMLIRRGADINYFNHRGESAFDFVPHNAFNLEVLRFLLHPTSSRCVVLQAIEVDEGEFQQHMEMGKMLKRIRKAYMLEYEPKSAIPAEELVPLKSALSDDRHQIIHLLITHGTDKNIQN
jgi:ankyrin repeat protein